MSASCASPDVPARASWRESERIKRECRHIYNKLHSIEADSAFVRRVALQFPNLLLTANLRCGAWYTDPELTSAVSYFKSTDGHTHQWAFSLKRNNLHLVPDILNAGGCIIVDSTRRGKSMPDALSKTVPIWCAVLNKASRKLHGCPADNGEDDLVTPPWMVPPSEHDQIETSLASFVEALVTSDLAVPKLLVPLRPFFATPQHDLQLTLTETCVPIVLVSASRLIHQSSELVQSNDPFLYVQGAGDDHENWARGLTPDCFWAHHAELLASSKDKVESMVDELVRRADVSRNMHWFTPKHELYKRLQGMSVATKSTSMADDVEIGHTGVIVGCRSARYEFTDKELDAYSLIIHISSIAKAEPACVEDDDTSEKVMHLCMARNKRGLTAMRTLFPPAIDRAHVALAASETSKGVLICCEDGKDLSGSLAVAILTSCFDETRSLIRNAHQRETHCDNLSKADAKRRLQWLVSANPRASPNRAFLLRINEILLSKHYRQSFRQSTKYTP